MDFKIFVESSTAELYQSTIDAFPNTTKRQHSTNEIQISNIKIVPFLGMKTLFLKTEAISGDHSYEPIIVFKNVNYESTANSIVATNGETYQLELPSLTENHILARCRCPDFFWRFNYYNSLDKSLWGRKRTNYESLNVNPPANPLELPGLCKHILKFVEVLTNSGILQN